MRITAAFSAGQIKKELLLDTLRQGSKSPCSVEKRGVVLETFLDTLIFVRRELGQANGLSVPTVRKYLKMIEAE